MDSHEARSRFARSDYIVSTANQAGMTDFLVELFEIRIANNPTEAQNWATLAFLHYEKGEIEKALEVLAEGAEVAPGFESIASCVSDNIENGRAPDEGCQ